MCWMVIVYIFIFCITTLAYTTLDGLLAVFFVISPLLLKHATTIKVELEI